MRRLAVIVVMFGIVGCEAVLDFNGYVATPTTCDPLHPTDSTDPRSFVSCMSGQQCGRLGGFTCEAAGTGAGGTQCTTDADCASGLGCDDSGRCRVWCQSATDCMSEPAQVCDISMSAQYPNGTKLGFCGTPCTLATAMECGANQCVTTPVGARCAGPPGTNADYTPCMQDDDCMQKSGCQTIGTEITSATSPPTVMRCQQWCTTTSPACAANETCTNVMNNLGYCYAPCDVINPLTGEHACPSLQRCSFLLVGGVPSATVCEPTTPPALADDNPCTVEAGCISGDACRGFDHGLFCEDYCDTALETCPDSRTCTGFTTPRIAGGKTYGFCMAPTCDPLNPACGTNQTCELLDDNYSACHVQSGSTIPVGQSCADTIAGDELIDPCAAGSECVTTDYPGYCRAYCRLDQPTDCATTCQTLSATFSFSGHTWGYCPPPSCDPLHPQAPSAPFTETCNNGLQCRFDTLTTTICVNPTANDGIGATCALDTDCGGNAFCVHFSNNTYACRSTCRVGENDCSGTYPTCDQFTNDAYELNGVVYGYCGT